MGWMRSARDPWRHDPATVWAAASPARLAAPIILVLLLAACSRDREVEAVKATVVRYNVLLRDGYERQNMNFMREVASEDQATKLYSHMAALVEGGLRMSAALRDLQFQKVAFPADGEATAETREVWDFTHRRIATGEKFAEEKGFVYRVAYALGRREGRWVIVGVEVISGEPTHTTIPWPALDRSGRPERARTPAR